jgi:hypothetical protein
MLQMLPSYASSPSGSCGRRLCLTRYVLTMKNMRHWTPRCAPLLCAGLLLVTGQVLAQPPADKLAAAGKKDRVPESTQQANPQPTQREQRRSDLRLALQPQPRKNDEATETALASRRLTAQERAEMRQQLRQQRRESN